MCFTPNMFQVICVIIWRTLFVVSQSRSAKAGFIFALKFSAFGVLHFAVRIDASAKVAGAMEIDDLLSARCQSKCLFELEQRHKNNTEIRRQLRHHITSICKNDVTCSSCVLPCRVEALSDRAQCMKFLCKEATEIASCEASCGFLEQIHQNKPGSCPPMDGFSNLECSASCDGDGDCAEEQKCCAGGCSRVCKAPILADSKLLPIPDGITVQERKRKRSAIVRWIMKRMAPSHIATNANIFIVQWRWSVHQHDDTMSSWQTITMRNKMYAILKHVLAPGRFYSFRVAAVNTHGTYGFSKASYPLFKLSRSVKAPSAPNNMTVVSMRIDPLTGDVIPTIGWQPPRSDLPLKDYQMSWWKSSDTNYSPSHQTKQRPRHRSVTSEKTAKRKRSKSANENADDDSELLFEYDGENENGGADAIELLAPSSSSHTAQNNAKTRRINYGMSTNEDKERQFEMSSTLLPSYSSSAELKPFVVGEAYTVELYASIESSDGELRGEPAILHIPTNITDKFHIQTTTQFSKKFQKPLYESNTAKKMITAQNVKSLYDSRTNENLDLNVVEKEIYKNTPISTLAIPLQDENEMLQSTKSSLPLLQSHSAQQQFFDIDAKESKDKLLLKKLVNEPSERSKIDWDEHYGVELKAPYFEKDGLKTALSWIHHPSCQTNNKQNAEEPRFRVRIRSNGECVNELPPQEFHVDFCVANLENLQFECQYHIEVIHINTGESITKMKFTTAPCLKTPSATKLNCPTRPKRPDFAKLLARNSVMEQNTQTLITGTTAKIKESTKSSAPIQSSTITYSGIERSASIIKSVVVACTPLSALAAECSWRQMEHTLKNFTNLATLVGYRIILDADNKNTSGNEEVLRQEKTQKRESNQKMFVSVVGPEERRVHLQSLIPNTLYRFRVQPLTVHGLGVELFQTYFKTPLLSTAVSQQTIASSSPKTTSQKQRLRNPSRGEFAHSINENAESAIDALSLFKSSSTTIRTSLTQLIILVFIIFPLFFRNINISR